MARSAIQTGIFSALNTSAIIALLGSTTATNRVIYNHFPQEQPHLASIEPASGGWLAFWEDPTVARMDQVYEYYGVNIAIFTTTRTLADGVLDQIDTRFNWRSFQQNAVCFGDRILLMSRRTDTKDTYDDSVKLHRKDVRYTMQLVQDPWTA